MKFPKFFTPKEKFQNEAALRESFIRVSGELQKTANERNEIQQVNEALESALVLRDIQLRELRSEMNRMLRGEAIENSENFPPDYQVVYIPVFKEWPFPADRAAANQLILANEASTPIAIVRVMFHTGQDDK